MARGRNMSRVARNGLSPRAGSIVGSVRVRSSKTEDLVTSVALRGGVPVFAGGLQVDSGTANLVRRLGDGDLSLSRLPTKDVGGLLSKRAMRAPSNGAVRLDGALLK